MSGIPCPQDAATRACKASLLVTMCKEKKGGGGRRKSEVQHASFGLEKTTPRRRPSSPSLTRSTWLATFPLPLACWEPVLSPAKRPAGLQVSGPHRGRSGSGPFGRSSRCLGDPRTVAKERRQPGMRKHREWDEMDLGATPRLWNATVAASRNLATEALRLRSALPLGLRPDARPAPAAR